MNEIIHRLTLGSYEGQNVIFKNTQCFHSYFSACKFENYFSHIPVKNVYLLYIIISIEYTAQSLFGNKIYTNRMKINSACFFFAEKSGELGK